VQTNGIEVDGSTTDMERIIQSKIMY